MRWPWSSTPSTPDEQPSSQTTSTTTTTTTLATPPPPTTAQSAPSTSQSTSATSSQQNDDFNAAYPHLAPPSTTPQTPLEIDPAYPTTMSCRAAFDQAFYCSSIGGHFNDIYRYGELRACSEQWADWRFCMGLKARTENDKVALIQERYREKEEKLKERANSEDLWRRRGDGERHLGAFDPDWKGEVEK